MRPVRIEGDVRPIGAPGEWSGHMDKCSVLFVRDEVVGNLRFMRSAWEAAPEEAGWLLAGASLHLGVSAPTHPVLSMSVGPVPMESPPVFTIRQACKIDGKQIARVDMYAPRGGLEQHTGGRVWSEIEIGAGGFAEAAKIAIESIEKYAKAKGIL